MVLNLFLFNISNLTLATIAKYYHAENPYPERHYADCHYAKCHGTFLSDVCGFEFIMLFVTMQSIMQCFRMLYVIQIFLDLTATNARYHNTESHYADYH